MDVDFASPGEDYQQHVTIASGTPSLQIGQHFWIQHLSTDGSCSTNMVHVMETHTHTANMLSIEDTTDSDCERIDP